MHVKSRNLKKVLFIALLFICTIGYLFVDSHANDNYITNYRQDRFDSKYLVPIDNSNVTATSAHPGTVDLPPWTDNLPISRTTLQSNDHLTALIAMRDEALRIFNSMIDDKTGLPYDYVKYNQHGTLIEKSTITSTSNIGKALLIWSTMYYKNKSSNVIIAEYYVTKLLKALTTVKAYAENSTYNVHGLPHTWLVLNDPAGVPHLDEQCNVIDEGNLYADLLYVQSVFEVEKPTLYVLAQDIIDTYQWSNYVRGDGMMKYGWAIPEGGGPVQEVVGPLQYHTENFFPYLINLGLGNLAPEKIDQKNNSEKTSYLYGHQFYGFDKHGHGVQKSGTFLYQLPRLYMEQVPEYNDALAGLSRGLMEHVKHNGYTLWGMSPCAAPDGNYIGIGAMQAEVVAPHALAMALNDFPSIVARDLTRMQTLGLIQVNESDPTKRHIYDSYNVGDRYWRPQTTVWDLALFWMALTNYLEQADYQGRSIGIVQKIYQEHTLVDTAMSAYHTYRSGIGKPSYNFDSTEATRYETLLNSYFDTIDDPITLSYAIDDFDDVTTGHNYTNNPITRDANWQGFGGTFTFSMVPDHDGDVEHRAVQIDYNKSDSYGDFFTIGELNLDQNWRNFTVNPKLSMRVKGTIELLVKFKDVSNNETGDGPKLSIDTADWQTYTWDLSNTYWNNCDLENVQLILFHPNPGSASSGTFFIDEVYLGDVPPPALPTPTPTPMIPQANELIDNFDNDHAIGNQRLHSDATWPSSHPEFTLSIVDNNENGTKCLKVDYNKSGGAVIDAVLEKDRGDNIDFTTNSQLMMDVKGNLKLKISIRDEKGFESGHTSEIVVNSPSAFTTISWNLESIENGVCDLENVKTIYIHPDSGQTSSGTCYFDNVVLNGEPRLPSTQAKYSSFFGGNVDENIEDICIKEVGGVTKAYVVGSTTSDLSAIISSGAIDTTANDWEGFLAIFSNDGTTLEYLTYLGGDKNDDIRGIDVGDDGKIYLTGATWSNDFVTTDGSKLKGGRDAFVVQLNPTGDGSNPYSLAYSSVFGDNSWDYGFCIDTEEIAGELFAYIGGFTHGNFPTGNYADPGTPVVQPDFGGYGDGYVVKINMTTQQWVYATYLGGQYWESINNIEVRNGIVYTASHSQSPNYPTWLAVDDENIVPGGNQGGDGIITILNETGTGFEFSTFIGPNNSPATTVLDGGLAIGDDGSLFAVGSTKEIGFEAIGDNAAAFHGGEDDGIFVKVASDYSTILFATCIGGDGIDVIKDIKKDTNGNLWIIGYTNSSNFPEGTTSKGKMDIFTMVLNSDGEILWSNRFGGDDNEIVIPHAGYMQAAIDESDNSIWLVGSMMSDNYPVTNNAHQSSYGGGSFDGFITVLKEQVSASGTGGSQLPPNTNPLIDDFDNDRKKFNQAATNDAAWFDPENEYLLSIDSTLFGNNTSFLKVDYTKTLGNEWANFNSICSALAGDQLDYTTNTKLSMRVTGRVTLQVKFRDIWGNESDDVQTHTINNPSTWRTVVFDYSSLDWKNCDPTQVKNILFFPDPGVVSSGKFYLDDLTLGEPVIDSKLIDNFENDGLSGDEENKRDAFWFGAGPESYTLNTVGLVDSDGTCLQVDYNKSPGQEWAYISASGLELPGNLGDVSLDNILSINIKGAVTLQLQFKDINGNESNGIQMTNSDSTNWSILTFDYSTIDWQSCDPTQIAEILLFPAPGQPGTGVFYIDNISLGTDVVQAAAANGSINKKDRENPELMAVATPTPPNNPTATPTMDYSKLWKDSKILAYPNPGKDEVTILYEMYEPGNVTIEFYKMTGEMISKISEYQPGGQGQTGRSVWDARNVAPGIYLVRVIAKNDHGKEILNKIKKIAIIK